MAIVSLKPNQDINVDAGANWQRTSSPGSYNSYWELLSNGVITAGEYAYPGWPPPADGLILGLTTFAFPIGSVINSVRIRTQYNSQSGGSLMAYLRSGATRNAGDSLGGSDGSAPVAGAWYATKPGGGAWDQAAIDALTLEYKLVAFGSMGTYGLYEVWVDVDYTPNVPPSASNLVAPSNASTQDLAAGFTFDWDYVDPNPADTQSAYALRRKVSGAGAYEYWNATTNAWQSTEIFNASVATAVTFGAGKWTTGNVYNWSVATKDPLGFAGPYATDFTVTASAPAIVTVTDPSGSVTTTSRPTVAWSLADPDGDPQQSYQVRVFSAAQYGIGGFNPATSPSSWDSGEVNNVVMRAAQVGVDLVNGTTYRAYVRVKTNGQYSLWVYTTFTLNLTPPNVPALAVLLEPANARVRLTVTGTHAQAAFPSTVFIVEYSEDAGATWQEVRGAGALVGNGTPGAVPVVVYDYEAKPNIPRIYRAKTKAEV